MELGFAELIERLVAPTICGICTHTARAPTTSCLASAPITRRSAYSPPRFISVFTCRLRQGAANRRWRRAVLERLAFSVARISSASIDPEGDYSSNWRGLSGLGDAQRRAERHRSRSTVLAKPGDQNIVVNLLAIELERRPAFSRPFARNSRSSGRPPGGRTGSWWTRRIICCRPPGMPAALT